MRVTGDGWKPRRKLTQEEHDRRYTLYKQRKTDRQIAKELNVTVQTILAWRKSHNLPMIAKKPPRSPNQHQYSGRTTLCWDCSRALRCAWILQSYELWDTWWKAPKGEAYKTTIDGATIQSVRVEKCKGFIPDEER